MAENTHWNKKIFAMLLEQAKGVRSWRQFAAECDISYVQMRKLATMTQENPPRPKLIRKITANAFGDIDLADLMFAAGLGGTDNALASRAKPETAYDRFRSLPAKDRRTVEEFIDFLYARSQKQQESDQQDQ